MSAAYTTLIDTTDLTRHLNDPDWVLFDCRHNLTDPDFGRAAYKRGHVPGAVFLDLDSDLSGPRNGRNGRHPLPDPERLAAKLAACGVDNHTQVVAYDDAGGIFAARLWWLLRWLGHHRVAVLDGGFQAWCQAAHALSESAPEPRTATYRLSLQTYQADAAYVLNHLEQPDMLLLDARSPDRFRGENETLDPVAGHIPGAQNRFFRNNLGEDGRFKPASLLRDEFNALLQGRPPQCVVHQCGSGVTACHNALAMEIAEFPGALLYAGSWSEWCANPANPVVTASH